MRSIASTKIKALPVRTDNAMQEILANSFLERPTVVRLEQRRGRFIKPRILQQQFNREVTLRSLLEVDCKETKYNASIVSTKKQSNSFYTGE